MAAGALCAPVLLPALPDAQAGGVVRDRGAQGQQVFRARDLQICQRHDIGHIALAQGFEIRIVHSFLFFEFGAHTATRQSSSTGPLASIIAFTATR